MRWALDRTPLNPIPTPENPFEVYHLTPAPRRRDVFLEALLVLQRLEQPLQPNLLTETQNNIEVNS